MLHQGDQYGIAVKTYAGDSLLTPSDVDGMKIKIGEFVQKYPGGELTYDDEEEAWVFHLSQQQSLTLGTRTKMQFQYKVGASIQTSDTMDVLVKPSIIKDEWT